MRALVLDTDTLTAIGRVVEYAHANPIPRSRLVQALENPSAQVPIGDDDRLRVIVPMEYRCVFSVEDQPMGFVRHLSVSIPRKGYTPSPESLAALMAAFGFSLPFVAFVVTRKDPPKDCMVYLEKLDYAAVNVVEKIP